MDALERFAAYWFPLTAARTLKTDALTNLFKLQFHINVFELEILVYILVPT